MIYLIIKSYLTLLVSVAAGSLFIFCIGIFFIFKKPTAKKIKNVLPAQDMSDFTSIAGDDVFATQLDLARAFIETEQKQSAKMILESVLSQGSEAQQQEAKQLLSFV